MTAAVKPSEAKRIEERVREGLCLIEGCDGGIESRGLCQRHYQQFIRRMREQGTKEAKSDFEAKAIRRGLALPAQGVRDITRVDPFEDL